MTVITRLSLVPGLLHDLRQRCDGPRGLFGWHRWTSGRLVQPLEHQDLLPFIDSAASQVPCYHCLGPSTPQSLFRSVSSGFLLSMFLHLLPFIGL